ncbi:MAG: rhodanese-like domain-containing protein [Candidatus Hinthialibacter antarcticus]|nr:rhodanese-like domain-containing protein [Candidatus Hinthialibacter antarcticus]
MKNKFLRILFQAALLAAVSVAIGLAVNAMSSGPLPLLRQPVLDEDEPWPVVDGDAVFEHFNNGTAIMIDARPVEDYERGHIPGAINLPYNDFENYFAELSATLPLEELYIVYCSGGNCDDSHEVLTQMEAFGFEQLMLYKPGWEEWFKNDFPREQ